MSLVGVQLKYHGCLACKACNKVMLLTKQRGGQTRNKWVVGQCCVLDAS